MYVCVDVYHYQHHDHVYGFILGTCFSKPERWIQSISAFLMMLQWVILRAWKTQMMERCIAPIPVSIMDWPYRWTWRDWGFPIRKFATNTSQPQLFHPLIHFQSPAMARIPAPSCFSMSCQEIWIMNYEFFRDLTCPSCGSPSTISNWEHDSWTPNWLFSSFFDFLFYPSTRTRSVQWKNQRLMRGHRVCTRSFEGRIHPQRRFGVALVSSWLGLFASPLGCSFSWVS